MFGLRNDGKNVSRQVDPMVLFTPLIMPTRCESMNEVTYPAEYEPLAAYIRKCNKSGRANVSFMTIMAAAYARTVYHHPSMNYFVMGKRIYSHKDLVISLVVLKDTGDGSLQEALAKITLDPADTIWQVAEKMDREVTLAKKAGESNATASFAGTLLRIPILPTLVVWLARLTDRLGIMPRFINKLSPFHCSLFITNMMSIGLPSIYHHLYNFGTCSVFMSVGKPERQTVTVGGNAARKLMLPLGFVTDERICGGAEYAIGVHTFLNYLKHPELLELTVEEEKSSKE
ncbi:MAG: hypothetical protein IJC56_00565 [Clostridia bacterium]|nr:hypothetical protein [Clostridia bacterium]